MAYIRYPSSGSGSGATKVANAAARLALTPSDGDLVIQLDTDALYVWNAASTSWLLLAVGATTITAIGTIDSQTKSSNGGVIVNNTLYLQSADTSNPGLLTIGVQSIAGNKTFTGLISAYNLSGTNSGDVTIGTANGLALSGQILSLGTASASLTGALSSTDWSTFNNKQAALTFTGPLTDVSNTVSIPAATSSVDGYLSHTDWNTFNSKQAALTFTSPLSNVSNTVSITQASTSSNGYLSSTDWNTFNNKQVAGNYLTAITGDVVATGPGSVSSTIQAGVVSNSKLGSMAAYTIKGNNTGSSGAPLDLTLTQIHTMLGDVTTIGTIDGQTASSNGLVISGNSIYAQSASASVPGMVNLTSQTFAGTKTFNGSILPGTNLTLGLGNPSYEFSSVFAGGITHNNSSTPNMTLQVTGNNGSVVLSANGTGTFDVVAAKQRLSQDGTNFSETQYFDSFTLAGSTSSLYAINSSLSFSATSYAGAYIDYILEESTTNYVRVGRLFISCDGTNTSSNEQYSETGQLGSGVGNGLFLTTALVSGTVTPQYCNTNTSVTMRCSITRLRK